MSEVVQQVGLTVEHLHDAPQTVHYIQVAFRIHGDAFGAEHGAGAVADLSNGETESAGAVEHLDAEIHRVHNDQVVTAQAEFRGKVEFAVAGAVPPDLLQDVALHIEHEDLVAQRVSDVDVV